MREEFNPLDFKLPKIKPGVIKGIALGLVAVILLIGSIYQVSPEELGVILRFGKFTRTADPGLHFKMPLGIEKLTRVPMQRQLKLEFGFRTTRPGVRSEYRLPPETAKEAVMLTGDLNVVVVEWIVQYKIKDAYNFLFKLRNVEDTFRFMNEAVVTKIVGDNSVDEVLTIGRARIASQAKEELQLLCDLYEIGIDGNPLIFQDVNPPDLVKPSFNEVNESLQEKERKINEAWSDYNQEMPTWSVWAQQGGRGGRGEGTDEGDAHHE